MKENLQKPVPILGDSSIKHHLESFPTPFFEDLSTKQRNIDVGSKAVTPDLNPLLPGSPPAIRPHLLP